MADDMLSGDVDPDTFRSGATMAPTAAPTRGETLYEIYQDFCGSVSLADFMVIAAEGVMAATATSTTFDLKASFKSKFQFGRTTRQSCENLPPLPNPKDGCAANEVTFLAENAFNFSWRQTAALMGVHTLGKTHESNSGFSGWWTDEKSIAHFDNAYYVDIVNKGWSPSVVPSSGKSQWARSDAHQDDRGFQHPQMMLNTDMCLAFKDVLAESSNCCAWERFSVLTEAGVVDEHVDHFNRSNDIFCGFQNPFSSFSIERGWCCDNQGGQSGADIPRQKDDCVSDLSEGGRADGPAIEDVLEFAADEDVWLTEFVATWTAATQMGASGLKNLEQECVEMVKVQDDGRCKGDRTGDWGNLGKGRGVSLEKCKQLCLDQPRKCSFAVYQSSSKLCTGYATCDSFTKSGKTFQTWAKGVSEETALLLQRRGVSDESDETMEPVSAGKPRKVLLPLLGSFLLSITIVELVFSEFSSAA
jgi:hypothetical protein